MKTTRRMTELLNGDSSSGLTDESIMLFLAEGRQREGRGGGDESENVTVHEVPLEEVLPWLRHRQATADLKLLAGLFAADRSIKRRETDRNGQTSTQEDE